MLVREGHIDQMCRQAVAEGVAPEDALLMATLHPARYHGLRDPGAIAPGYRADLVLLEDLERSAPRSSSAGGRDRRPGRRAAPVRPRPRSPPGSGTRCARRRSTSRRSDLGDPRGRAGPRDRDHARPARHGRGRGGADGPRRARRRRPGARPRQDRRGGAPPRDGPDRARAWCRASGCAPAPSPRPSPTTPTTSWSSGVDDADMAACVTGSRRSGGGIAVAGDGEVRGELPLPVAGPALRPPGRGRRRAHGRAHGKARRTGRRRCRRRS